jgi:hypothetical protein
MSRGGFDVIIGNPPYLELKVITEYKPRGHACENCGNIYALVLERCVSIGSGAGRQGFIVPVSSVSTDRYLELQRLLTARGLHYSSFDDRPSRLFDGLEHARLTVHILSPSSNGRCMFSTRYNKWNSTERETLFSRLRYAAAVPAIVDCSLPKLCTELEAGIIRKLSQQSRQLATFYAPQSHHCIFYSRKVGYFLQVVNFEPRVVDGRGHRRPPSEFKELRFQTAREGQIALAALNSNLFYWFVTVFSDCRHVNRREVDAFPLDLDRLSGHCVADGLVGLAIDLMADLQANSQEREMCFAHDRLTVQCVYPKASKRIIDKIDARLRDYYGFTAEELDFIINYEVKYRMGRDAEEAED